MSALTDLTAGKRFLLVASTGGHLAELDALTPLLGFSDDSAWVSFDNQQSRSMLAARTHTFVPYVAPRDLAGTTRAYIRISRILKRERFEGVLSTGAAVGVSALLAARRHGLPGIYVESLARLDGPSVTGRIVNKIPGVRTFTQQRAWASDAWPYDLSIVDSWRPATRDPSEPTKIFVTVGTISPYRFDRLVNRVREIAPTGIEIRWQLGDTFREDLPEAIALMSSHDFRDAVAWADVVITHAGVGNILDCLEAEASTIVVPRRSRHGEHVDDHQTQIAGNLDERGLALAREADELTWEDVRSAHGVRPQCVV